MAGPVATHMAEIRPLSLATEHTGASGGPVAKERATVRIRRTLSSGTEKVCVARSMIVPRAWKTRVAVVVPTHFVGWISHPNRRSTLNRICAEQRASRAERVAKTALLRQLKIPSDISGERKKQTQWLITGTLVKNHGAVDRPKGRTVKWRYSPSHSKPRKGMLP